MSDNDLSSTDPVSSSQPAPQLSGGALLQRAREAQGLHIAALAVSLKVPVKKLEALEADRFDLLPDAVFVRALASSVCRVLKIDSGPILNSLPQTMAPSLKTDESGINTPFRAAGEGTNLAVWEHLSRPVVLAILVLLVGVLVIVFFPSEPEPPVASMSPPIAPDSTLPAPPTGVVPAAPLQETVAADAARVPASGLALSNSDALQGTAPTTAAASAVAGVVVTRAASAAALGLAPVPTTGLLVLRARGPSWVKVVDAAGVVQIRQTLHAGEVVGASGVTPLSVVVGSADATGVEVRGKPLDLAPLTKNNVARFEVQ